MLVRRGDRGRAVEFIQRALDEAGFNLVVDGDFGPATEAAVREFQRSRSLQVDGLVGNDTLAALGLDWVTVDPQGFRQEAVRLAGAERTRWAGHTETEAAMTPVLQEYYRTGVNLNVSAADLQDPAWHAVNFWSAVFISWLMRKAGAGDQFAYDPLHKNYIGAAKTNMLDSNVNNPFWAFPIDHRPPEVGDLVCKGRGNNPATWENVDQPGVRHGHCDIVTAVEPNRLRVTGGNVGGRVGQTTLRTDDQGFVLVDGDQSEYFAVIQVQQF